MTTRSIRDEGSAPSRLAAVCGAAYALLWLASGFFSPEGPADETATAGQISSFFAQNGPTLGLGVALNLVSSAFFVVFVGGLYGVLRRAAGEGGNLSEIAFAGGLLTAGLFLVGAAMSAVPLLVEMEGARPTLVETLYAVGGVGNEAMGDVTTVTRAVFVGAASAVALRYGGLPRWLGWSGAAVALVSLAASLFPLEYDVFGLLWFVAFMLFPLWVFLASVRLSLRAATGRQGYRTRSPGSASGPV